jgi:monoamine oxidase
MKRPTSVIVIGAGAAGWAASQKLVDAGLTVLMLEARPRIGGRILTLHNTQYPTDLGAEFVHEGATETLKILAGEDRVLKVSEKHCGFWQNQTFEMDQFWDKVLPLLKKMKTHVPDRPVADFVCEISPDLKDFEKAMLVDYLEGFNATDVYDMSESALVEEASMSGVGSNSRVVKGYDSLFDPFRRLQESSKFEVLLNCVVHNIDWKVGEAKVVSDMAGSTRTDYCNAVIVTVPTPILSNGRIDFYPAIDEKVEAAKGICMGPVFNVKMNFKEQPWLAKADVEFVHTPELTFGTRWLWGLYDSKAMTSWSGGHRAEKLIGRSRDEVIARALADIETSCKIPKERLLNIVDTIDFHDWKSDIYSQGAYSYVKVGAVGMRDRLAESIASTLYFAGEATMSDGSSGTVHGALRSGYRAADEILALPE